METVRKSTAKPTETECASGELPMDSAVAVEETVMPIQAPTVILPSVTYIEEAPELFGINPTAQQIEEFREKELKWRAKLKL